jgi:hypothetical protein
MRMMHGPVVFGLLVMLMYSSIIYAGTKSDNNTVKWKPKIRTSTAVKPTSTLSLETLRPFLRNSLILENKKEFLRAPYVIAQDKNRIEGGPGTMLYVRGMNCSEESAYGIYREGQSYQHPITGEKLGFEAVNVGTAALKAPGDPAVFDVVSVTEAIEVGARLWPSFASSFESTLKVTPAKHLMEEGFILSVRDGIDQIGRNQVVVISLGYRDGLVPGNTLNIMQTGEKVVDSNSKGWRKCVVQLPDNRIGSVLVFQTYEKLSLGLVLEATEIIHLLDKVKSH